jgi:hypothetical protein
MKWAPNKKLHFEVAVIRAIQTLGQTTLDEVIENLNALRDGKTAVAGRGPWRRQTGGNEHEAGREQRCRQQTECAN